MMHNIMTYFVTKFRENPTIFTDFIAKYVKTSKHKLSIIFDIL